MARSLAEMGAGDETLIRRFRQGDGEAFRVLFDRHAEFLQKRIQGLLAPLMQRKVSIADLLQETRIVAFERREDFEGDTVAFRRWLVAIAERKARSAVQRYVGTARNAAGREVSRDRRLDTADFTGRGPSPSQMAIASELHDFAKDALETLPDDYREVLRLAQQEGLTLADVAKRMGRSREAAKKLHQRAMFQFTETFRRLQGTDHD